jgi:hypothetical protein
LPALCKCTNRKEKGNEKGRTLRKPSLIVCDLFAPQEDGMQYIPTPPRAMTKLFDATCVPSAPTVEISRRDLMRSTLSTPRRNRQLRS